MSLRALVRFVVAMETEARDCKRAGFSFSRLKGGWLDLDLFLDLL